MKLTELKTWIESLPQELQESLDVVVAKEAQLDEDHIYRLDMPIIELAVDEDSQEALVYIKNDRDVSEEVTAPAGAATLDVTTGMGAPSYANRDVEGSGDVPSGPTKKKKKKKKKIKKFKDYNKD